MSAPLISYLHYIYHNVNITTKGCLNRVVHYCQERTAYNTNLKHYLPYCITTENNNRIGSHVWLLIGKQSVNIKVANSDIWRKEKV